MTNWQTSWQEISKLTGWELIRQPLDAYVNWWWDCTAYTFLNLYFLPYRMPGIHSEADKWVSQFTLNGIKASNICRPS
jgi:squalene cyclase